VITWQKEDGLNFIEASEVIGYGMRNLLAEDRLFLTFC